MATLSTVLEKPGGYTREWKTETWAKFFTADTGDEDVAAALGPAIGTTVEGLYVISKEAKRIAPDNCELKITYSSNKPSEEADGGGGITPSTENDDQYSAFDISVQTQHINEAIAVANTYGTPPISAGKTIGASVGTDGKPSVEGLDIMVPTLTLRIKRYRPTSEVTAVYAQALRDAVGTTNAASFQNFDAGEVLFYGVAATQILTNKWDFDYTFLVEPNTTFSKTVDGTPTSITKKGWEYIEYSYDQTVVAAKLTWAIKSAVTYQVYGESDFTALDL